jgi:hypothetical protein
MQWNNPGPQSGYTRIRNIDPAADWLLQHALDEFQPDGPEEPFPFITRIDDEKAIDSLNSRLIGPQPFLVSRFERRRQQQALRAGEYFTVFADRRFFDHLAVQDGEFQLVRDAPKQVQLSLPMTRAAEALRWTPGQSIPELADPPLTPRDRPWPPETVVIGIIDDGIGFAHERFRTAGDQTRIEFFWRQDGAAPGVSSVPYGREMGKGEIDGLIAGNPTDDEATYRAAGMLDFTRPMHKPIGLRAAHGTHVLDILAGEDPANAPLDRPIIAVQLPVAATANAFGAGLEAYVHDAIEYIRARARLLAGSGRVISLVINFSYAVHHGPHDATAMLEVAIDQAIAANDPPLQVVLPAGNGHATRCHARVRFPEEEAVPLPWRVQPDDRTSSAMQIWLPHAGPLPVPKDRVRLSITTPDGLLSPALGESDGWRMALLNGGEIVCYARYDFVPFPTERGVFSLWLRPTERLLPAASSPAAFRVAPHGVWIVQLENLHLTDRDSVQAWIARDDRIYGYPRRGRQSIFDSDCYQRFDQQGREVEEDGPPSCVVLRNGMMNGIGTGDLSLVVGGYARKELQLAPYSAAGPITSTRGKGPTLNPRKPDATLVSDDSRVHAGVIAAGSRSGSRLAMNGTSVAAPRLARWVANQFAVGAAGDRAEVRAKAIAEDVPVPVPPLNPDRVGSGRIGRTSPLGPPDGRGRRYWP